MRFSRSAALEVVDLGRTGYASAHERMLELVDAIHRGEQPDHVLLAEFEPVLTVGRAAAVAAYRELELPVHSVSRGGKATFHGPGQLVAYPLVKLEPGTRDLHAYLHALEEALIRTVADFGLAGHRDPRNTGCWVDGRKVASIGVAVRRWVTYHGVALNIDTDLSWFRRFDPCGLEPDLMTTMRREAGGDPPPFADVSASLARHLLETLREDN
jgi:lipoyl(octanoyl) transferase